MEKQTNYVDELKSAWNIALLKKEDMQKIAADESKNLPAFLIIIVAALLSFLGGQIFSGFFKPSLQMGLVGGLMQFVQLVLFIYVLSFVAKSMFKGKADHHAFFRTLAYGMIVTWMAILPTISLIGSLWGLIITVVILKTVHKLSTEKAIGALLVTIVAMIVLALVLSPLYSLLGYGYMGGSYNFSGFNSKKSVMNFVSDRIEDGAMQFQTEDGEASVNFENGAMRFETEDGEGTVEFGDGSMTVKTEDGESSMNFEDGTMVIQTEDGETIKIELPDFQ